MNAENNLAVGTKFGLDRAEFVITKLDADGVYYSYIYPTNSVSIGRVWRSRKSFERLLKDGTYRLVNEN